MPNRKTRDEIIMEALDLTDSPTLDQKERPDGVNVTGVLAARWLQTYLDLFHTKFPLSNGLACATITFRPGVSEYAFPTDFIQIYRNGMYLTGADNPGRLRHVSLDRVLEWLSSQLTRTGQPSRFTVTGNGIFRIFVTPDKEYTAEIWYYAMPDPVAAGDIPPFPPDHILIDCLHLRMREWLQMVPQGSALAFAHSAIAELQKSGISNEPEPDQIDLDPDTFRGGGGVDTGSGWMGPAVPR